MKQEKAQYTQGPWSYEMAKEMLRPFDSGIDTGHPESKVNARLIAAAPELLEWLQWCLDEMDKHKLPLITKPYRARARAAIAAIQA